MNWIHLPREQPYFVIDCDCFALRAPFYCGVWFSDDLRRIDLVNLVVLVISEIGCFGIVD